MPRTLDVQLEIAKAIRTLLGPDPGELQRQRRAEITALRRDVEVLRGDIKKLSDESPKLREAVLQSVLRKYSPDQPRVPAGHRHGERRNLEASFGKASHDDPKHPGWPAGTSGGKGGKFRPKDGFAADTSESPALIPVIDFSAGFHEAVVNHWLGYLKSIGIPAIKEPAVRLIGQPDTVFGYPDIIAIMPGTGPSVLEIKTGNEPITLTDNQIVYIPMMQVGWHIYSDDPRVSELGWQPGVPFPPLRIFFIRAPAPGQEYSVAEWPFIEPLHGSKSAW